MHDRVRLDHPTFAARLVVFAATRQALVLLWALFLLPRLAVLLIPVTPTSDADFYYTRAGEIADGLGYLSEDGTPTAYWPPGWPWVLAQAFRIGGESLATLGLLNLACAVLTGWLTLDLGRRLFGGELAGRAGLLLLALYPNSIGYMPLALTEVFYTALLLAGCWLLVARRSMLALAGAGLVFGLAMLVKAQTLVIVPLVYAIRLWRAPGWWRRLPRLTASGLLVVAVAGLAVLPWSLRNQAEFGRFVAISTNGGITLLTGNNDSAAGAFTPEDPAVIALDKRTDLGELERDAEAKRLGLEWIEAHPGRFAALMPLKLLRLWGPDGEAQWAYETGYTNYAAHAGLFRLTRVFNQAWYWSLLLLFSAAFVVMLVRRRRGGERLVGWWLLPYGVAAYPSLIAMVFSGQSRFHYPAMPFVCMAAGWLVADWITRRANRAG
jgi:4-amino-4-deoxy-L-arabinose transferase-like glycosyltransferase